MNPNLHSNSPGIGIITDKSAINALMRTSNTHEFLSPLQSLPSTSALYDEFVESAVAREQRIQALMGTEYNHLFDATAVKPIQPKSQLINSASAEKSTARHLIIRKQLAAQAGHSLLEMIFLNQKKGHSYGTSLPQNQNQKDKNLIASSTSQVTIPSNREARDVVESNRVNKTSISQYIRNYSADKQRLTDSPKENVSNSMSSKLCVLEKKFLPIQRQDIVSDPSSFSAPIVAKGRPTAFPKKLYQMLLALEMLPGGSAIASFLPHGRGFAIHKPKEFVKYVVPKYFDMSSLASFRRQLKMYDFQKIRSGPEKGCYYHKLFVRGQPHLFAGIKRTTSKRCT